MAIEYLPFLNEHSHFQIELARARRFRFRSQSNHLLNLRSEPNRPLHNLNLRTFYGLLNQLSLFFSSSFSFLFAVFFVFRISSNGCGLLRHIHTQTCACAIGHTKKFIVASIRFGSSSWFSDWEIFRRGKKISNSKIQFRKWTAKNERSRFFLVKEWTVR